jgi:hypothetical protein
MSNVEGFRVRNYKVLRDITLGKLWNLQYTDPLFCRCFRTSRSLDIRKRRGWIC